MKCGGVGYPEEEDVFPLCLSFGEPDECDSGHVCTRTELHFTHKGDLPNTVLQIEIQELIGK